MVRVALAIAGMWTAGCAAVALLCNPAPCWKLVVETHNGSVYVADHGMTRLDCSIRAKDFADNPVVYCEDETWEYSR